MLNKDLSTQEELALIKERVLRIPTTYEFSSYVEYICGREIGDFTEVEIERASEHFLPLLERNANSYTTPEALKQAFCFPLTLELETGAAILGSTAVAKEFVEDIRTLPKQHYWVIWFCIEVIQYLAIHDILEGVQGIRSLDETKYRFDVPSGETITYHLLPISWKQEGHKQTLNIVGLLRAQHQNSEAL
jgi:hypothetical protein